MVTPTFDPTRYVKDFETAWNAKDLDGAVKHHADEVELQDPLTGQTMRGKDKARENARGWFDAFSEMEMRLLQSAVQERQAAVLYECKGRHTGDLQIGGGETIPATNKRVTVLVSEFLTLGSDGKVTKDLVLLDSGKMLQQLGVIPAPGAAQKQVGKGMPQR
jgi:ketosteroid isomerase-like protein